MKASLAILTVASATALASTRPDCVCCKALSQVPELAGKVLAKDTESYDTRLDTYYSANAALSPWCMVLPTSAEDVSAIAKVFYEHQCPFGIRSGAHSAFTLSNGVADGITVDFSDLNGTTYDAENHIAHIGPGSRWEPVFDTLNEYGATAVGGRASVVGVGGFTTGGGYSFFTNRLGFACDNVVNYEVVLANGTIVNANSNENADLWKALKGGSGNFGFVTRIDQRAVDTNMMWGGITMYPQSQREQLFAAYHNFVENQDQDTASQNIISQIWDGENFNLVSVLSNIDAIENAPAFDEYLALETLSSSNRIGLISELVPEFTGPTPLGLYANWFAGLTANDARIQTFLDAKQKEYVAKMREAAPDSQFQLLCQMQPVTAGIVRHGEENGGNVLGLEPHVADGPTLMWLFALTIDTAENQELIEPIARELVKVVDDYADEIGVNKNWKFLNYANSDQDPIGHYGAENIALLQEVSAKYDPEGVFQSLRLSGFKIPA